MAAELTSIRYLLSVASLDAVQASRSLSAGESEHLESVVRRLSLKNSLVRWSEKEDRVLKTVLRRRARKGPPKPFQRNDEVRLLAETFGRTEWAVYRRMERLRKCSRAKRKAERVGSRDA